jgi:hypothetical protein
MTRGAELTEEGGAAVLQRDSGVEEGPPWRAMVSEVTGGRRSGEGGGGTQAGCLVRSGGDDSGALGGFDVGAGEKGGRKIWLGPTHKRKRGGSVRATPHGGRGRTGPGIPTAAQERRRQAPVGQCLTPCGSRGAGGARGLRVSTWAGLRRKELGQARENSANLDLKRISKLNMI